MIKLTAAQLRELRHMKRWGEPTGPEEWHASGALWFHARDRVIGALERKGLIESVAGDWSINDAGRAALDELDRAKAAYLRAARVIDEAA